MKTKMNKQEVVEKLKERLTLDSEITPSEFGGGYNLGIKNAIAIVGELDEPEKAVVSQFIADWYEEHKEDLEYNLYRLCINFHERKLYGDLYEWFKFDKNKPIETLILMHKIGYEVKKEKLYTVEIPNPNGGTYLALCKDVDGKLFFDAFFSEEWKTFGKCKLTESEIKEGFAWAWQFAKEVEDD